MRKNKVFLFGLDNAGKTSIVNAMKKIPEPGNTTPTLRFSIDNLILVNTEFVIWDAPGQIAYRESWEKGLVDSRILCFIIDILAPDRFEESKGELDKILSNEVVKDVPLIICFNKLDIPDAKKDLPTAKELFKVDQFTNRKVTSIETTIFNPNSILDLKHLFVKIIQ